MKNYSNVFSSLWKHSFNVPVYFLISCNDAFCTVSNFSRILWKLKIANLLCPIFYATQINLHKQGLSEVYLYKETKRKHEFFRKCMMVLEIMSYMLNYWFRYYKTWKKWLCFFIVSLSNTLVTLYLWKKDNKHSTKFTAGIFELKHLNFTWKKTQQICNYFTMKLIYNITHDANLWLDLWSLWLVLVSE